MRTDPTFIGLIVRVIGSKVFVEISQDLPSSTPIINGRIYKIGQVGSFVKIPMGALNIYAIVTMVGANPIKQIDDDFEFFPYGNRWLEIQLVGESYDKNEFQRGVSIYPTIDDEVHIVTDHDLSLIHASISPNSVRIGSLANSESLSAFIDIDKLLTRHGVIIGSTGSGKSNCVSSILRSITSGNFPKSKIILIDTHSEYQSALKDYAKVFSIDGVNKFKMPFWCLSYNELALILFDKKQAADTSQDLVFQEQIFEEKKKICESLKAGKIEKHQVTVDSPIPFSIKAIWYQTYLEEHATVNTKGDLKTAAFKIDNGKEMTGDYKTLTPPEFLPPSPGAAPPFRFKESKTLIGHLNKLYGKLKDNRLDFLFDVEEYDGTTKDLNDLLEEWLNHEKPITVLDLGGIPSEITDLIVGLISRFLFESMFWGRNIDGFGRRRPILLVFEEAHSYLPKGGSSLNVSGYASRSVRRICKEGRKYGIGGLIVSQRPSDLDETILSQCGTFITLRLSNSEDQGIVRTAMPDNLGGLADLLPTLRTGEAIIVGESVKIPCRVRIPLIEPRPDSGDPEPSKQWKDDKVPKPNFSNAITFWRKQKIAK